MVRFEKESYPSFSKIDINNLVFYKDKYNIVEFSVTGDYNVLKLFSMKDVSFLGAPMYNVSRCSEYNPETKLSEYSYVVA